MPLRRRNAIRRRLEPARLALARLVQPKQQQQQQNPQQQQQQPTSSPQTDARPFSFDGREAITTNQPTNPRHPSPKAPATGTRLADIMLPRRQTNTVPSSGGQSQPGISGSLDPPYQGKSNLPTPERCRDLSFPASHDSSWTSAYEGDSSLGPNPDRRSSLSPVAGSLPLHPQHGWRRNPAVLSPATRALSDDLQAWRDPIPSNPSADEDDPAWPHSHRQGLPTRPPLSPAPVAHAVRIARRDSISSSNYSLGSRPRSRSRTIASESMVSTGAAAAATVPPPIPRQPSWSSAISEVSEASERRSVSPVRDFDNPRRRRRYGWDGSQMPRLSFSEQ